MLQRLWFLVDWCCVINTQAQRDRCRRFMGICAPFVSRGGKKGPVFRHFMTFQRDTSKTDKSQTPSRHHHWHQYKLQSQQMGFLKSRYFSNHLTKESIQKPSHSIEILPSLVFLCEFRCQKWGEVSDGSKDVMWNLVSCFLPCLIRETWKDTYDESSKKGFLHHF